MQQKPTRSTILFILITSLLNLAGIGIIGPVIPFLVERYTAQQDQALVVSLLFTSYSLFQFLATPTLGALSDHFGRRPVLLLSLLGSAAGYLMLGIGGSLAMLFAGRIIDGLTGGNLATIYAYAADISEPQDRTRFFGRLGAISGFGFILGPAIGGLAYWITGAVEAPMYLAALLTLANTVWGYFAMPETLTKERRSKELPLARLNPLGQLLDILRIPQLRLLLIAVFLWAVSFAVLQSNLSYFAKDQLGWDASGTSAIFTLVGIVAIITQDRVVPRLLPRLGEGRMAVTGMLSQAAGFILVALIPLTQFPAQVFLAVLFVATGNGLVLPSLTGLLSQAVSRNEQGRIQGGNQSIQALGRVLGPTLGGVAYGTISHSAPYISGALGLVLGAITVSGALGTLAQARSASSD
ncbi:MAG: MFS transporter [Chloroflexi bacterium]|nr:MFS transporter [Chloroflexota bacterium]